MTSRYRISAERSTVLIGARSTMGPIAFETRSIEGEIAAQVEGGEVDQSEAATARIEIGLAGLRSGNELYDAELRRRIDTTRYPTCNLELTSVDPLGERRYSLVGDLTFHDTTRPVEGAIELEVPARDRLVIIGEKTIDIRDFNVSAPSILMLKIYPDVRVQMFLEATLETDEPDTPEGAR